jgi:hypothetical protein
MFDAAKVSIIREIITHTDTVNAQLLPVFTANCRPWSRTYAKNSDFEEPELQITAE